MRGEGLREISGMETEARGERGVGGRERKVGERAGEREGGREGGRERGSSSHLKLEALGCHRCRHRRRHGLVLRGRCKTTLGNGRVRVSRSCLLLVLLPSRACLLLMLLPARLHTNR